MFTDVWQNCYDLGWQGEITPESFSHPAKISRALVRRIYKHAFGQNWLVPGQVVCDPFAGIGGTALDAMWNGLAWVGVELEPKFVKLGQANIALWQRKYGSKAGWGSTRIIQGDSRQLASIIESAEIVISSPPFSGCGAEGDGRKKIMTNLWNTDEKNSKKSAWRPNCGEGYQKASHGDNYGASPGQLGSLPEGRFEAVIRPATNADGNSVSPGDDGSIAPGNAYDGHGRKRKLSDDDYDPETFWEAAKIIVARCHAILKPGGMAIWVVKDFVRKGKRIPFSDQWQALCESAGFRLVCRHQAMLVKSHGQQETMWEGTKQLRSERKSFFRRLAEKKGSPEINWEDIICLRKD